MTNKTQNLGAIRNQLLKIAQDIAEPASPAMGAPAPGSPEEVMELIDQAIDVLEVAEESVPAENPKEEEGVIGAKTRKAQDETQATSDEEDETEKEKEAKARGAQDDPDKKDRDREREADDEKKQMEARIASLEKELEERTKSALAEEYSEIFHEDLRQAKYDEIINSNDSVDVLQARVQVAKETAEQIASNKTAYKPAKNESGYLSQFKKASLNKQVPVWRL